MPDLHEKKLYLGLSAKFWLWVLVLIPGIPFTVASLLILGYSNIPLPLGNKVKINSVREDTEELIVLIHGKGDRPSSWADGFAEELRHSVLKEQQQVLTVDWGDYSTDLFRCTLNGRRIGRNLGRKLLSHKNIKRLHLIGHSAGSFVVYGMCEAVKKKDGNIFVQTTYLDPVSIYGGVDWGYGTRNFGSCADISDAYIDHDDGVPGSNEPLKHPHTFDVTALKKPAAFSGSPHLWPIEYYRHAVTEGTLPFWDPKNSLNVKYPPKNSTIM